MSKKLQFLAVLALAVGVLAGMGSIASAYEIIDQDEANYTDYGAQGTGACGAYYPYCLYTGNYANYGYGSDKCRSGSGTDQADYCFQYSCTPYNWRCFFSWKIGYRLGYSCYSSGNTQAYIPGQEAYSPDVRYYIDRYEGYGDNCTDLFAVMDIIDQADYYGFTYVDGGTNYYYNPLSRNLLRDYTTGDMGNKIGIDAMFWRDL